MTTRELIEAWRGARVSTRRRGSTFAPTAALQRLVGADDQRIRIAVQNTSMAPVQIQHSFNANNEVPFTIPAQGLYLEDFDGDDDQVTTEFWVSSSGLDQFGNVVPVSLNVREIILE